MWWASDLCRKELKLEYNGWGNLVSTTAQDSASQTLNATLRIVVNGEPRTVAPNETLLRFIHSLQLDPERVAVEMNRRIVKRDTWPTTVLAEGTTLEIVQFVGGG
jgi:sulfur carrier protein